jgi:hypothetical protein
MDRKSSSRSTKAMKKKNIKPQQQVVALAPRVLQMGSPDRNFNPGRSEKQSVYDDEGYSPGEAL